MRVVMLGYQTWGHRTLAALLKSRHEVCMVITHPASDHEYESIWADSVEDLARSEGIEVFLAKRPTPELIERVAALAPDVMVANNWRTRLPEELFTIPTHGTLNLHDSLLPKFTGFSPVIWSLISGASQTGVTAHMMDAELDTGDVLVQRAVDITPTSTGTSLVHATLENRGMDVRLGLGAVRHIGDELAQRMVDEREAGGRFASLLDLTGRVQLSVPQTEALATAGALGCFGITRREALWAAGAAAAERPDRLPGVGSSSHIPCLPGMTELELAAADVWATGISPDSYPTQFLREHLDQLGVVPADQLLSVPDGTRVLVAGAVTHRQRPATAQGVTFINLEDETGMVNILCSQGVWARHRKLAQTASAMVIRGVVQNATGAVTVVADRISKLDMRVASRSRDFR